MFKKLSTGKLLAALAVLVIIYFSLQFFGGKKRSASFRDELVAIDAEGVTQLIISKGNDRLKILKESGSWQIELKDGKKVPAIETSVTNSLQSLSSIKPGRVAAKKEEKWKEYSVDSTGTRVEVYEGSDKTLDIVLGRLGVKGQRQFYSFVRLFEDNEVYTADNFMSASFSTDAGNYRNRKLISIKKDSVQQINFIYPGDSSFNLVKSEQGVWAVDDQVADSASVVKFLNGLQTLNGRTFVDDFSPSQNDFELVIYEKSLSTPTSIKGYLRGENLILNSSQNEISFFQADDNLRSKLFYSAPEFLGQE